MTDCIFCKIVNSVIPCHKVYEDDFVLAFLDIAPVNYGHTLVIPKLHVKNFEEISEENLKKVYQVVKKIGKAIKSGLKVSGYNVIMNNDPVAGQIVPHFHVHLIPRNEHDGLALWPQGSYGDNEANETCVTIKQSLN